MEPLFEHGKKETFGDRKGLEKLLCKIWQTQDVEGMDARTLSEETDEDVESGDDYQPFLTFDGNYGRARNYVGFIQRSDELIEIYPKVFKGNSAISATLMLQHIFYWFSYCRKWRFPHSVASLDTIAVDSFPELIIYLIANHFLRVISEQPLQLYQPVEAALFSPRGSINFKRYIGSSLAHGNYHQIECDYEPFMYDNAINRTIKYCARLLLAQTGQAESLRLLQEIIFILDEVDDRVCTASELARLAVNPFFADYVRVMEYCGLLLNQERYANNSADLSQWSLLFPMEYIFEDFVAGFLEDKFRHSWKVQYQKSDMYLSDSPANVFQMRHDIFLERNGRKIIVDAKYKLRDPGFKQDPKKGIAQNDLYQMVSYAFKRGCTDVLLVYPNVSEEHNPADVFEISSGFDGHETIKVVAMEIPFWSATKTFSEIDRSMEDVLSEILL